MQQNGIRADQIMQVRGFADQHLRKTDAPLDPSNRRVSLIVQYLEKPKGDAAEPPGSGNKEEPKPSGGETPKAPAEPK
jgi:chemotaxis protein MotB